MNANIDYFNNRWFEIDNKIVNIVKIAKNSIK